MVWSSAPQFELDELQVLQNKAINEIYNPPRPTPSVSIYGKNILPIRCLTQYLDLLKGAQPHTTIISLALCPI